MDLLDGRLKFRHLALLIAVYDHGSVVRAAESLHLTQPAATRTLHQLGGIAELPFLVRVPRGMRPTVHGEALVGHARAVVAEIRRAREHLTGLRQGQDGTVTVGTLLAGANVLLPRAVARLKQERPRLTIVVREGTPDVLHPALLGGELDLIVGRVGSAAGDALRQRMLYREPIRLAVRAGHPLLTEGPAGGTDALAHPWILPVELPSVGRTVGVTEAAHPTRTPVLEAFLRHFDEEAALLRASLGAGAQG
ncbi:LysR family transcriptional regulator [Streptomyces cinereoruber]|uniref:LysR family transcriptional regulator n=1 Tax=Streptomyces cinereoruber TaxID=67260 RepID=UPI003C2C7F32